jgi:threonine dehydratase
MRRPGGIVRAPYAPDRGILNLANRLRSAMPLEPARIEEAAAVIDPVFRDTPQFVSDGLTEALGATTLLKVETANPIGSFKGRGTDWLVRALGDGAPVACASAGNFGQGVAYAGRSRGVEVHVHVAADANPGKVARMRALGAHVHAVDGDFDAAKEAAEADAAAHGRRYVVDGREAAIAEGAGTMALEAARAPLEVDHWLVPVGNGSLIAGIARWVKATRPQTRVIAVGPAGAPVMERAWRTGDLEAGGPTATIADGLAARVPVAEAVAEMRETVDAYVLVDDEALLDAMRLVFEHTGLVVEPSGAAGVAGAVALRDELRGAAIATPLCGANVAAELLARLLGSAGPRRAMPRTAR